MSDHNKGTQKNPNPFGLFGPPVNLNQTIRVVTVDENKKILSMKAPQTDKNGSKKTSGGDSAAQKQVPQTSKTSTGDASRSRRARQGGNTAEKNTGSGNQRMQSQGQLKHAANGFGYGHRKDGETIPARAAAANTSATTTSATYHARTAETSSRKENVDNSSNSNPNKYRAEKNTPAKGIQGKTSANTTSATTPSATNLFSGVRHSGVNVANSNRTKNGVEKNTPTRAGGVHTFSTNRTRVGETFGAKDTVTNPSSANPLNPKRANNGGDKNTSANPITPQKSEIDRPVIRHATSTRYASPKPTQGAVSQNGCGTPSSAAKARAQDTQERRDSLKTQSYGAFLGPQRQEIDSSPFNPVDPKIRGKKKPASEMTGEVARPFHIPVPADTTTDGQSKKRSRLDRSMSPEEGARKRVIVEPGAGPFQRHSESPPPPFETQHIEIVDDNLTHDPTQSRVLSSGRVNSRARVAERHDSCHVRRGPDTELSRIRNILEELHEDSKKAAYDSVRAAEESKKAAEAFRRATEASERATEKAKKAAEKSLRTTELLAQALADFQQEPDIEGNIKAEADGGSTPGMFVSPAASGRGRATRSFA